MNTSWVPVSAAALVSGALALFIGAALVPATGDDPATTLEVVHQYDARWFAVALLFFGAAVGLLLGLPSLLMLFRPQGRMVGIVGIAVMATACAGTAGYAMVLVFFRALVLSDAIRVEAFDESVHNLGLTVFILGWVATFYLGELLIAISVLRARTTSRWIPGLLIAHVASLAVSRQLPDELRPYLVLLVVVAFSGLAIAANGEADRTTIAAARVARL